VQLNRKIIDPLHSPQLARSSVVLMINTLLAAALGFLFWVLAARVFTPESVGAVAAVSSLIPLFGTLAGFGLPEATLRFLGGTEHPRSFLTRAICFSTGSGLLVGALVWVLPRALGSAPPLLTAWWVSPLLALSVAASAASSVSTATLISLRRPHLVLFETLVGGLSRLVLTLLLTSQEAPGLFLAAAVSPLLALTTSLLIVLKVTPASTGVHRPSSEQIRFAATNWIAASASLAPRSVVIAIVSWRAGAEAAAWIAIPLMVYPLLVLIPSASARALYAESSRNTQEFPRLARQTLQFSLLLTSLLAATASISAPLVLSIFGSRYAEESSTLLRLLMVAAIFSVPNYLIDTTLNIRKDKLGYLTTNILGVLTSLTLVLVLSGLGPVGIGLAWILAQLLYTLTGSLVLFRRRGHGLRIDLGSLRQASSFLRSRPRPVAAVDPGAVNLPTMVFIITYGRTGSTVLQSLLNDHVGVSIRGENHNAVVELFRAHRALRATSAHASPITAPPSDPWFGANLVNADASLDSFRKIILTDLLGWTPGVSVLGFKEVRHTPEHFRDLDELRAYVRFLVELFPTARFVLNVRNVEDCSKSGWWNEDTNARATLLTSREWMLQLEEMIHTEFSPAHAILLDHDVWSIDPAELVKLQEFLGLPADLEQAARVLGRKLIHMQPNA
jgi:O-antigen/teichoic acid export membrane protein